MCTIEWFASWQAYSSIRSSRRALHVRLTGVEARWTVRLLVGDRRGAENEQYREGRATHGGLHGTTGLDLLVRVADDDFPMTEHRRRVDVSDGSCRRILRAQLQPGHDFQRQRARLAQ